MKVYERINNKEQIRYVTTFVKELLENDVPSIYLGDIPKERRDKYFSDKFLVKDKYFSIPLGRDISKYLVERYNSCNLEKGNWTEANGVIFYANKNMIIVLDYKSAAKDEVLLIDLE